MWRALDYRRYKGDNPPVTFIDLELGKKTVIAGKFSVFLELLTNLLSCCDTVQCVTRDEDDAYFEPILDVLVDKKYVTA